MKLKGKLFDRDILLLIDSGANHNFISQRLVTELGLTVYQTKTSFVRLGDGNQSGLSRPQQSHDSGQISHSDDRGTTGRTQRRHLLF
uniref:Uncharacterized protein n=1 Tax=Cajanus cajan TaxID=3821 RepID=A0A151SU14_CAJCA|nr:hypothetical protein KK1_004624 [Cajanus cajan]